MQNNKLRVAINGFGRIGRAFFRQAVKNENIDIVAINDLGDPDNLRYLLKYNSLLGEFKDLDVYDKAQKLNEKDPTKLPWRDLDIDVVLESTGFFRKKEEAKAHIYAGAKRVLISAPSPDATVVLVGVNTDELANTNISSNASCTTNALSPVLAILEEHIGVKKALLSTTHSYTSTQRLVDSPSGKDFRRGRAAALNIIPTSTGAAKASTMVYGDLEGLFDGVALRVPTALGSIIDLTFVSDRQVNAEEINTILSEAAQSERWKSILAVSDEPLVSSDVLGRTEASIVDLSMTRVVGGDLIKVMSWYDNENGYAHTLLLHMLETAKYLD